MNSNGSVQAASGKLKNLLSSGPAPVSQMQNNASQRLEKNLSKNKFTDLIDRSDNATSPFDGGRGSDFNFDHVKHINIIKEKLFGEEMTEEEKSP